MPKIEVIKLVAHLIITLAVIVGYIIIYLTTGKAEPSLQGCIYVIIGYWFGAVVPNLNGGKSNDSK